MSVIVHKCKHEARTNQDTNTTFYGARKKRRRSAKKTSLRPLHKDLRNACSISWTGISDTTEDISLHDSEKDDEEECEGQVEAEVDILKLGKGRQYDGHSSPSSLSFWLNITLSTNSALREHEGS